MPAVVGLDVSVDTVAVCVLLADGSEPVDLRPGAEALSARLAELAQQHGIETFRIGMEATGLYWFPLARALTAAPPLAPYQPQIYALNPKLVHDFRRHFGALPKTDRADAFLIAERIRFGRQLPPPFFVDLRYAPLQRLTRYRVHLTQTLAREKGYFVTEELAQTSVEELAPYLTDKGRGHFKDSTALAQTLQRAAKDSYRLDKVLADPLTIVLGSTMATIRTLQHQLKEIDATIARELAPIAQTLSSVPGLGPVWTAGLIAEIGDIHRFADHAALAQYAGLVWKAHESGSFQAEDTPMTKAGNHYLRYYLVEAANSARVHCLEYTAYYRTKVAQSSKHAHKRALVLTARKFVRLVAALLRSDTLYQPPDKRQARKEGSKPSSTRPGRNRRTKHAAPIS